MNLEDDSNNDEDLIVENFSMDRKPPAKVINVEKVKRDLIDENISMDTSDDVYDSISSIELDKSSKDGFDDVNVKDNSSLSWYESLPVPHKKSSQTCAQKPKTL